MELVIFQGAPHRVMLGAALAGDLAAELNSLGLHAPFLVSTPGQARRAAAYLADIPYLDHFAEAAMHTPVAVTEHAMAAFEGSGADCLISFGGGSSTGLGKAVALRTGLPLIAIGTTYGGSEMTAALGETKDGVKVTQRDPRILPRLTVYDVDLTLGLPVATSMASGINAIAHAVEAVYAPDANPIVTAVALDAIRALSTALTGLVTSPADRKMRYEALRGACQAGFALNAVGMGLHHKLCHTLGGMFDLPHAETHAVVLPYAMAYNQAYVPEAAEKIAAAVGASDATRGLHALVRSIAPARSLRELGMPEDGIGPAADLAVANPYWNPRPIERGTIEDLIARAWAGEAPG